MSRQALNSVYARYLALGWSVIPAAPKTKTPLVSWKLAQRKRTSLEQTDEWARRWPTSSVGVVTGGLSGVFVIDVDSAEALESPFITSLPATAMVRTSKGVHYYFRTPNGPPVPTKVKFLPGIDCRGEGGYAIVPPSVHESGAIYEWITPPEMVVSEMPAEALLVVRGARSALESFGSGANTSWRSELGGVAEGGRNDAAARLIGKLLADAPQEMWQTMVWKYVNETWNFSNNPPLPTDELRRTFESIANKELEKRRSSPLAPTSFNDIQPVRVNSIELTNKSVCFAIPEFLNEGLTLMVGKAKAGKSTLSQQIALSIASGNELFYKSDLEAMARRRFPVKYDDGAQVLHIGLEEDVQTYIRRGLKMMRTDDVAAIPDNLTIIDKWPKALEGGIEALDLYLSGHPDIQLVIIDSAAKFVGTDSKKNNNAFAGEYALYDPLHKVASKNHIPIVLLTHARKDGTSKQRGEPIDDVAGTGGGPAAADNVMVLRRFDFESEYVELFVTGREMKSFRLNLRQEDALTFCVASAREIAAYIESKKPSRQKSVA